MAHKNIFKITALAAALALTGCGGGDGYFGGMADSGSVAKQVINISNVQLLDPNGAVVQTISAAGALAKVKVTDQAGKAISSALVTFSSTGGIEFGSSNGAVLTNAEGEATISIKPTDAADTGSYQLTATVEHNDVSVTTAKYNFSLQAVSIILENVQVADSKLNSGASTNITLKTSDANTKINQNNVTVDFTASCGTFEPASVVSSNQGDVTTSYKAIGVDGNLCEGAQKITMMGSNIAESKTIEVNIAAIEANSLLYTSTDKVNLGIRRSGSASSGQIEFTLYANGVPAANKEVSVELLRAPEDLSFLKFNNRNKQTVKSDSAGKVIVTLYPGDKPGPVEIKATLVSNANVFAVAKNVAVSTGRVTQNGLSLSVSKNVLQNSIDGDTATITARMVDRTGNPVPKGTVISFVSEGGSVTPNCTSDDNGTCTVTLTTQYPRPLNNRVTVLAYVEGDKQYVDVNANNTYESTEDTLVSNIGSFFLDANENNQSDVGEYIYNRSIGTGTTSMDCAVSTFKQPNLVGTCDNGLDAIIRQQLVFGFAEDTPVIEGLSSGTVGATFSFQVYGNSQKTVPMPSGTKVSVEAIDNTEDTGGDASAPATTSSSCEAEIVEGHETVPDVINLLTPSTFAAQSSVPHYVVQTKGCQRGDEFKITVQAPNTATSIRVRR